MRRALPFLASLVLLGWSPSTLSGQSKSLARGPHRLEITLEKRDGASWRVVDPGLVFEKDDRVRFRVRLNFSGFLYVMNHSTSGAYTLLFPGEDTGQHNRLEANREYLVPATEGWFRITGPAGHEVVYWLVSPMEFGDTKARPGPLRMPPKSPQRPPVLMPRCDDTILRARGNCVDTSAGPKPTPETGRLPSTLAGVPDAAAREMVFLRQKDSTVVSAPEALPGPVVFEFRLAHR